MTMSLHQDTPSPLTDDTGGSTVAIFIIYPYRAIYRRLVFDHLDKAFCILKVDSGGDEGGKEDSGCHDERGEPTSEGDPEQAKRDSTIIRRVDLIVSPPDQYPFALVSWTGSKVFLLLFHMQTIESIIVCYIPQQFNRSMRRYSVKECGVSVTAHGIYSIAEVREPVCTPCAVYVCFLSLQAKFLKASNEKEVFSILKLAYLEPWERNC